CSISAFTRIAPTAITATKIASESPGRRPSTCTASARHAQRASGKSLSRAAAFGRARLSRSRTFLHRNRRSDIGQPLRSRMLADFRLVRDRTCPLAVKREPHAHVGALAEPAVDFDLAAVQRGQSLHDREPKAGPVVPPIVGGARLEKRLAQARQIVLAD